ncbi:hypothetical protein CCR75_002199 [Bremia lactucae]|uniref:Uncharacterized protein n=1 Tax=Bremia lactucae TaxID=4779 RepID=A0A976IFV9_BRELC|nr:hypothetical protein CCR75_002199 [Bremia lactucae]
MILLRFDAKAQDFLKNPLLNLFMTYLDQFHFGNYEIVRDKLMEAYVNRKEELKTLLLTSGQIETKILGIIPKRWMDDNYREPLVLFKDLTLDRLSSKELLESSYLKYWCELVESNAENPYPILLQILLRRMSLFKLLIELVSVSRELQSETSYSVLKKLENLIYERWKSNNLSAARIEIFLQLNAVPDNDFFRAPLSRIYLSYIKYCHFSMHGLRLDRMIHFYGGVPQMIQAARDCDFVIASIVESTLEEVWKEKTMAYVFENLNLHHVALMECLRSRWFAYWARLAHKFSKTDEATNFVFPWLSDYMKKNKVELLKSAMLETSSQDVQYLLSNVLSKHIEQLS